jgi:hypothetical protein
MLATLLTSATIFASAAAPMNQVDTTTTRYRVDTRSESVADLSGVGAGEQRQAMAMSSYITVKLADTTGGKSLRVTVDSMTIDPGTPIPASMADSVRGMTWTGLLGPDGTVSNLKGEAGALNEQFTSMLNTFFPRTKGELAAGARWIDTVNVTNSDSASSTRAQTITRWSVGGKEQHAGVEATRLDAAFDLTMTASGQTPQGSMDMEGTGTGTGTYFVAPDGMYLGGTTQLENDMTVSLAAAPMPIPVTATTKTTISTLP